MNQDSDESRQKLLAQVGDASRLNQIATDQFDERVGEFLGINRTDGRCLDIITRLGRVSAGHLANESGLTTGAVTAVVDRLEAAGYVQRTRDALDRRKVWLESTPHTLELVGIIFGVYDTLGPALMRHFSDAQLAGILAFLRMGTTINRELAAGLREHAQPAAEKNQRIEQARAFRRAVDALAPSMVEVLAALAPQPATD